MVSIRHIYEKIIATRKRIDPYIVKTPVYSYDCLIKPENLQYTGSFKLRGAASKLTHLQKEGVEEVITASTGNHGLAVAYMLEKLGMEGNLYVPKTISKSKKNALAKYNIDIHEIGTDSAECELKAREMSEDSDIPYISPYNDEDIIAGQGTIGLELMNQVNLDNIDAIYVTVGGGGLISGIGSVVKTDYPEVDIIGCQPKNSPVMYESVKAGHIVDYESKSTVSDGSAGGIEKKTITFELVRQIVDYFVLIDEEEIKDGIIHAFRRYRMVIEGAAGVALAASLQSKNREKEEKRDIVILCGGNIDLNTWKSIIM